jgi:peroxisome-assembly ATPase
LLTGPPGSGKSFLVDLWYKTIPTQYKTRIHYNQLVLEIYRAVWQETQRRMASVHHLGSTVASPTRPWNKGIRDRWRDLVSSGSLPVKWARMTDMSFSSSRSPYNQTIAFAVAQRLILRHWLLVFDEVQLLDVSSATLLADVLSWFWRMGGVIVGTSNKVPDDLYRNGVQRERLEPFVEAMKVRCPVISMRTSRDWREVRAASGSSRTWYTAEQRNAFEHKLAELSANEINGSASKFQIPLAYFSEP